MLGFVPTRRVPDCPCLCLTLCADPLPLVPPLSVEAAAAALPGLGLPRDTVRVPLGSNPVGALSEPPFGLPSFGLARALCGFGLP